MKTVFSSEQCVHVWAQQTQPHGRNQTRSVYFHGPSIFSYGSHFEMARVVKPRKGPSVVLVTNRTYSVTTSRHQTYVRHATRHLESFVVPSFTEHKANLAYFLTLAKEAQEKALRARDSISYWVGQVEHHLLDASRYAIVFPEARSRENATLRRRVETHSWMTKEQKEKWDCLPELIEKYEAERRGRAERQEAEFRARQEAARRRQEELDRTRQARLDAWLSGALTVNRDGFYSLPCRLRVREDRVETSHGAEVPVREARMLYRALRSGRDVAGMRVGHFHVRVVTEDTLEVGCHSIPFCEVARVGEMLLSQE